MVISLSHALASKHMKLSILFQSHGDLYYIDRETGIESILLLNNE